MGKTLDNVYKHQSLVYKYFLYVVSVALIVFFFPKGGKFKYEFQKGKPWQYENLYAPIDFSIQKTQEEIQEEQSSIRANKTDYYTYNASLISDVKQEVREELNALLQSGNYTTSERQSLRNASEEVIDEIYLRGIFQNLPQSKSTVVVKSNEVQPISPSDYLSLEQAKKKVTELFSNVGVDGAERVQPILRSSLKANLFYDDTLTESALNEELSKVSYTRGEVDQGQLIISKGEIVENDDFKILNSLKDEYESDLWMGSNYYFILLGYTILVALVLIMLFLFLKRYRNEIFQNNNKVTFIFFNILLMVVATTLMVKHYEDFIYMVPLCILPLILKNFFDARLGLFVHVLTVLILGFIVPNSFEYIFLQIITGIVTILTASELYKRANLFISVGQITLIYIVGYFAFHAIHEGNMDNIEWILFGVFVLNGLLTLFCTTIDIHVRENFWTCVRRVLIGAF